MRCQPMTSHQRVLNMEMKRHLKNGDARKRIPPSEVWPCVKKVGVFVTFSAYKTEHGGRRHAYRFIATLPAGAVPGFCTFRSASMKIKPLGEVAQINGVL
jgi:hypothetical protein